MGTKKISTDYCYHYDYTNKHVYKNYRQQTLHGYSKELHRLDVLAHEGASMVHGAGP